MFKLVALTSSRWKTIIENAGCIVQYITNFEGSITSMFKKLHNNVNEMKPGSG